MFLPSKWVGPRGGSHNYFIGCMLVHLLHEVHLQISCIQASMVLLSPAGF